MNNNAAVAIAENGNSIIVDELVDDGAYGKYPLARIRKSQDNRKRFNEQALQELAASIKEVGVAQPILIRPVTPTAEAPEDFEIVAGERRYRASIIAGMTEIPAMARTMTDLVAAKIRILENLQREDPHEMEEAEGYQLLMLKHGFTADQLVDEVKKSRGYIYGRLKLCALTTEVREQFLDDKLSASTALLIARIPVPALQVKAANEIRNPFGTGEPMSHRQAASHIQARYMLKLSTAIFSVTDAKLLAAAGACTKCPKRTGNQPEVFEGIDANVCTDPDCFAEKRGAHGAALLVQANKKGIPVLEGDEGAVTLSGRWNRSSELVTADMSLWYFERNAPATKNNGDVKDYLKDDALPAVAGYVKKNDGSLTTLYKRADMQAALEAAGTCETVEAHAERMGDVKAANPAATAKDEAEQKKRREREALVTQENAYRLSLYKQLRQRASVVGLSLSSLREFAKAVVNEHDLEFSLHDLYESDVSTDLEGYIDNADGAALQLLLIDVMLGRLLEIGTYNLMNDGRVDEDDGFASVVAMARHEGIDVEAVRAETFLPAAPAVADEPAAPTPEAHIAADDVAEKIEVASVQPAAQDADPVKYIDQFPMPIDVSAMQYDDLVKFILEHPSRINELKEAVINCMPRFDLINKLDQAATSLGYEHKAVVGFVLRADGGDGEAEHPVAVDVAAEPDLEPTSGADVDGEDADDLAGQVAELEVAAIPLPKKAGNKKAKPAAPGAAKTAKKPTKRAPAAAKPLKPAEAWPFPKSSTAKREASALPASAEVAS